MSDDNKKPQPEELQFEEATEMTIEEAVQKEADLAAGVTAEDSVLDKYIKRNRDKVGEMKFDNKDKVKDLSEMDTSALDNFIEKQRLDLEATGIIPVLSEADLAPTVEVDPFADTIPVAPVTDDLAKVAEIETFYGDTFSNQPSESPRKKWIIGSLAALLLTTVGLAYGLNHLNKQQAASGASSSSSAASKTATSSSAAAKEDVKAFEDLYKSFFVDEALTKPKNDAFGNLSALEEALNKLKGTSDYTAAKAKYDSLVKAITAIQAVNDKFETPAIVDGEKVEAKLKEGATFDDLTATILNTGKANLDTLLQAVITEAKGLVNQSISSATTTNSSSAASTDSTPAPAADKSAEATPASSNLQRSVSRVPYNAEAVADSGNSAWAFTPGVLEEILRVSRERGYFSGDNYILEPVNIINGNGYYNLYRTDGTYLFSINAKTGYFVGNGSGYADALDY